MRLRHLLLSAALPIVCAASLSSCGASSTARMDSRAAAPAAPTAGELGHLLPDPAELGSYYAGHSPRRGTSGEKDFLLFAYDNFMPHSNVGSSGVNLTLDPAYSSGGPLAGAAYCVYSQFYENGDLDDGDIALHLNAASLIANGSAFDLWVGFANFATNRWDWYRFNSLPGQAGPAALGDYRPPAGDDMFHFALLATGNAHWELGQAKIGNLAPLFDLGAVPNSGQLPLQVDFTVMPSAFPPETITKIEWDFEGDGSFELETAGDVFEQSHTYTSSGVYQAACRLTDDENASNTVTQTITATSHVIHTWGGPDDERAFGLAADSNGNVYLCGKRPGEALLLKFDQDLSFQWARSWQPVGALAFAEYHDLVCIGSDIYVCGFVNLDDGGPNDSDIILHKYDSDGNLTLQKRYGDSDDDDEGWSLATDGSSLYLTGYTNDDTDGFANFLAAKLNLDGTVVWGKHDATDSAPFYTAGIDAELWPSGQSVAFLAAPQNEFSFSPCCLVALDPSDGSLNVQQYYTDSEDPDLELSGKALANINGSLRVIGNSDNGFDSGIFSFTPASVGGAASNFVINSGFTQVAAGAAAVDPSAGEETVVMGGTTSTDAVLTYSPVGATDLPFDELSATGSFFSEVFDVAAMGGHTYLAAGYADYANGAHWDRDTLFVDTATHTIVNTAAGFSLSDWTANAADTAITPASASGTLDSGAGGQDILLSLVDAGV